MISGKFIFSRSGRVTAMNGQRTAQQIRRLPFEHFGLACFHLQGQCHRVVVSCVQHRNVALLAITTQC